MKNDLKNHKQNLHVHSVYCDGKDTPEEMIEAAIAAGFSSKFVFNGEDFEEVPL